MCCVWIIFSLFSVNDLHVGVVLDFARLLSCKELFVALFVFSAKKKLFVTNVDSPLFLFFFFFSQVQGV